MGLLIKTDFLHITATTVDNFKLWLLITKWTTSYVAVYERYPSLKPIEKETCHDKDETDVNSDTQVALLNTHIVGSITSKFLLLDCKDKIHF